MVHITFNNITKDQMNRVANTLFHTDLNAINTDLIVKVVSENVLELSIGDSNEYDTYMTVSVTDVER